MSFLKKLAGQTAIYGVPGILSRTLNFLLTIVHTGVFLPEAYGAISELYAIGAFATAVLLYGMETAYFRFVQEQKEKTVFNTLQSALYSSTLIFLLGVLLNNEGIASGLGYTAHPNLITYLALILAFDVLTAMPLVRLRNQGRAKTFVGINLISVFTNIGLNLFFFTYWFPQHAAGNTDFFLSPWFNPSIGVGYVFIANIAGSLLKWVVSLVWGIPNPRYFNFPLWKSSLKYSWPLVITGFAGLVNEVADRTMIKPLLEPKIGLDAAKHQLGVYGACYKLSILINISVQAFRYAAEPLFFKQISKREDATMVKTLNFLAGFVLLVFITVSLFLEYFKYFIRSEAYWEGLDVVPVLLLANCFLAMHVQISMWYKLSDKTLIGAGIAGVAALITIAGNWLLIPVLGFRGAAYTTLAVYGMLPVASFLLSKKRYFIPYEIGKISSYFILAICIVFLGYFLFPQMHFALKALLIVLFIAVFCVREKLIRGLNEN